MKIKFMWNGIKVDNTLYRAHFCTGPYVTLPAETITVYGKDCRHFPVIEGLSAENDSDMMTDYFENDRIRITPGSKYYQEALACYQLAEKKNAIKYAAQRARIEARRQLLLNAV